MNIGRDFHMVEGEGKSSYSKNSRLQEKILLEAKPVLEEAIRKVYQTLPLKKTMVIADLGCSSGPNTLHVVSEVINAIADHCNKLGQFDSVELQFVLNDLPGNDFNQLFKLLEKFKKLPTTNQEGETLPTYYVSGLPSSFYTRLFPQQAVHLFHSSCSLHWLTQGLVEKKKLDSFHLPLYEPTITEVENIVLTHDKLFHTDHIQLFESSWDPFDDSHGDIVHNSAQSGENVSNWIRAVLESPITVHFGESILDALFLEYARRVAKHLETKMDKLSLIVMSLKKK